MRARQLTPILTAFAVLYFAGGCAEDEDCQTSDFVRTACAVELERQAVVTVKIGRDSLVLSRTTVSSPAVYRFESDTHQGHTHILDQWDIVTLEFYEPAIYRWTTDEPGWSGVVEVVE